MTLGALSLTDRLGGWPQGCLVFFIFFWLLLALLGIRNSRLPVRVVGFATFVIASALWLGMHPAQTERWQIDAGLLGYWGKAGLLGQLTGSPSALNAIGALLIVCSVVGLLIAADWLPLLALAPLAEKVDARWKASAMARELVRSRQSPAAPRPPLPLLPPLPAPTMQRTATATVVAPAAPPPPAPAALAPVTASPVNAASVREVVAVEPSAATTSEVNGELADEVDDGVDDVVVQPTTQWERFKPRARPEESPDRLPVDKGLQRTHNTSLSEGESRAVEVPPSDVSVEASVPAAAVLSEASSPSDAAPQLAPEQKDAPVFEHDRNPEDPTDEAGAAVVATLDELLEAASNEPPAASASETLAPRRKKADEPSEDPAEEPTEEPAEKPDEEGEGEGEGEEGEEDDEESWDDDDAEEGDDKEDWEEDDEKEDEDEKEEEEPEEDDEEEEEEEEEDDDDWDEDEDEEEDDKAKDDEEDEEEEGGGWDDDQSSSTQPTPKVTSLTDESITPPVEPRVAAVELPDRLPAVPDALVLPRGFLADLPDEERQLLTRAVALLLAVETVSLSKLQRELAITYYAAARVFERLEKEGFIAPYSGSLARSVRITREEWDQRLRA